MPKKLIRKELLARRNAIPGPERRLCGQAIQRRLLETALFRHSRVLGLYSPVRNEVPTDDIFRAALAQGKRMAYPRVQGTFLEFIEVAGPDELVKGAFGILEPKGDRRIAPGEMDMLVVPGVAFDLEGGRLGYGKGFYDRLLAGGVFRGRLIGLCYELQLLPRLPREDHDVLMDVVVTEQRTLFTEGPATVL